MRGGKTQINSKFQVHLMSFYHRFKSKSIWHIFRYFSSFSTPFIFNSTHLSLCTWSFLVYFSFISFILPFSIFLLVPVFTCFWNILLGWLPILFIFPICSWSFSTSSLWFFRNSNHTMPRSYTAIFLQTSRYRHVSVTVWETRHIKTIRPVQNRGLTWYRRSHMGTLAFNSHCTWMRQCSHRTVQFPQRHVRC